MATGILPSSEEIKVSSTSPAVASVNRPGIKPETLAALGIRHVAASEAFELVGARTEGIYIPYPDTKDKGRPYGRLRLAKPEGGKKYHQQAGTSPHTYCPTDIRLVGTDLLVVEGEFKAISLGEAGFPTVGLSGFYSWRIKTNENPDQFRIEEAFASVVSRLKPKRIVLIGDPDTATNYQFSDAVVSMVTLLGIPVALFRIDYDEKDGKGVDDIRGKIGPEAFSSWVQERLRTVLDVGPDMEHLALARRMLEREENVIRNLTGDAAERAKERLVKLAANVPTYAVDWVAEFCRKTLGFNKTDFKSATLARRKEEALKRKLQRRAKRGPIKGDVLNNFIMVGAAYYGFSFDPDTKRRSSTLTTCHREFVLQSLKSAGYSEYAPSDKKTPVCGEVPGLSMMQAAIWYLHNTRCKAVTDLLFRPYGRVAQPDGTTVFNNARVSPMEPKGAGEPKGPVIDHKDPRIHFTYLWLKALFPTWEQLSHFLSIVSYTYRNARVHAPKKPLAIFLVGPTDSGKSLLIDFWLPQIHGQEVAGDAHRLLRGENGASSVLKYYVCKLSDKDLGNDSDINRVRSGMLSLLADYTTGGKLMYENVTVEEVINLFAFSSNPDGSVVSLLRDMSESIKSKLAVFHCGRGLRGAEMNNCDKDDVSNPSIRLLKEMPYFCSLLENWPTKYSSVVNGISDPRFGVRAYFNPEIATLVSMSYEQTAIYEALIEIDEIEKRSSYLYEMLTRKHPSLAQIRPKVFTEALRKLGIRQPTLITPKEYPGPDGAIKNAFFTVSGLKHKAYLKESAEKAEEAAKKKAADDADREASKAKKPKPSPGPSENDSKKGEVRSV